MAIRNANEKPYGVFSEGVDDTTVIGSPDTRGTLSRGWNTDLVDDSLCKKRNGFISNHAAWSTRRIRGGFEYKKSDGTLEQLLYGEASTLTGISGILGKVNGTSTPTTITSGLLDGVKPTFLQFRTLTFIFNGINNLVYNGVTTRQIGINAPSVGPTLITTIPGDLNTSGSYIWVYTYRNSTLGSESSPSLPSEIIPVGDDAATSGARFSVNPGDSSLADTIRVYRTTSGGQTFFVEQDLAISATSFDSILSDASLGNELELDNSRLDSPGKFAIINDSRMIVGGFTNNPNRLRFSKVGINGPMPESFQAADFCDCNQNDGDQIVGLGVAGTTVIVVKERSVGKLVKIATSSFGLERTGSQKYIYEEISNGVTGLSHHTIVSQDGLTVWMGRDDFYGTDGSNIYRLGKRVRNTLKSLNFSQAHKFSVINKTDTQQLIWSVCRPGEVEPDFQFMGHYRNAGKLAFTYYKPGTNTTTHPGLQAASLFEVTLNKEKKIWFGASSATGLSFQMDTGTSDNTAAIYWDVRLPWEDGGRPAAKKMFHSNYVFAAGAGVAPNNTLTNTFEQDLTEDTIVETATTTLTSTVTNWAAANWGAFNWAKVIFSPIPFFPHVSAHYGRYGYSNTFADQPVAIKATTAVHQSFSI